MQNSYIILTSGGHYVQIFVPGFHIMHIPALVFAFTMIIGGMGSLTNPHRAMLEFGLPRRIVNARGTVPVFQIGNARTMVLGLLVLYFYLNNQFTVVDTILTITGAYCAFVDSYILSMEGQHEKSVSQFINSLFFAAWGFFGLTAGC